MYLFGPFTKPDHVRGLLFELLLGKLYIYIVYNLDTLVGRALVLVPVPALHRRCDCLPLANADNRCCHRHK